MPWVCVSGRFPRWRADRAAVLAAEHSPPALGRQTSLEFLNGEEKPALGLAADVCSRDSDFIHLKDACSFGICYPAPAPQSQAELTDHFYFYVLCHLKCFFPAERFS